MSEGCSFKKNRQKTWRSTCFQNILKITYKRLPTHKMIMKITIKSKRLASQKEILSRAITEVKVLAIAYKESLS
jgi:hypothetical protein